MLLKTHRNTISRHSEAGECRPSGQCVELKVVMVPISAFGVPQIWYFKWFAPDTFLVYIKQVFVLDDSQTNFSCASNRIHLLILKRRLAQILNI